MEGNVVVEEVTPRAETVVGDAAKVPVSTTGTEASVVGMERWEEMQRLRAGGQTISAIARLTGFDRKTVRACLRKGEWAPYQHG